MKLFISFICVTLAVVSIAVLMNQHTPAPAEEISPEQSPYAVFYFICGTLQHVLMTDEPPTRAGTYAPLPTELSDLLAATPPERVVELRYVGPECFYSRPQQAPKELI